MRFCVFDGDLGTARSCVMPLTATSSDVLDDKASFCGMCVAGQTLAD